jgi:hypothetical protein
MNDKIFLDKLLAPVPQISFEEIYSQMIKDFIFSSGNDTKLLFDNPSLRREQLEEMDVNILGWSPDSGNFNVDVKITYPDMYFLVPVGKRVTHEPPIAFEDLGKLQFKGGCCFIAGENTPIHFATKYMHEGSVVKAFYYDAEHLSHVMSVDKNNVIKTSFFCPEIEAFIYAQLIKFQYNNVLLENRVNALELQLAGIQGALSKASFVVENDFQPEESTGDESFAEEIGVSSEQINESPETQEQPSQVHEDWPFKKESKGFKKKKARVKHKKSEIQEQSKEEQDGLKEQKVEEAQPDVESVQSEEPENVVAVVEMDCEGNITGVQVPEE